MANRKVLINRHTSTSGAPIASEMFKGEIAVAHKTGEEILWTKNNDDIMVPFISCAQTMTMINNAISAADVTYDVKAANGDAHVEVVSGGTEKAKVFTVSSKDVQSKAAFDAYSAATDATIKENYNTLSGAIDDVLSIITTSITGDSIINVQPTTSGAGTYSLSHKEATAVTGFNKLTTDAYGHVTASTAVEAADIEGLGFKNSAWTEEKIASAITSLDSSISASTSGKYLTAISIKDGLLDKIEEAIIPVLEVESAGTGNVVEAITVDGHKISYTTTSVATSHDIEELSAATKSFSAGTYSEFNSAFTAINNLSADTEAADNKVFSSAKTYSDELIAALDSSKVATDNKHYITAITIEDGKLSTIGEAEIPVLASAVTGTGNVVTDIAVNDHTITFAKDLTVASDADLKAVSGIVDTFSAATVAEFNSAFTAIQAMDKAASAEDGKVVTTVSEVDGVVSETKANVKDLQLGGYSKDATATGDIASTDTINAALSKLENKAAAITIANADGSINVTTAATGTDINVNIKSGEHVLAKDGNAGLYTNIKLSALTPSSDLVKEEYALYGTDNTVLGDHIKIYKDQSIVSITLEDNDGSGHTGQYLKYTYVDASGNTQSTYVNVSSFLVEAEFASGVTADASGVVHGVVDPDSEAFLTVGGAGFKLSGVQDAINSAITALDVTDDAAVAGQYVAAIEQTDGLVAVKTRANVSEAVLNNYAKGSDATAVAATDTVNQAISKLENQVDAAKAAATTKVVEGTDAGNNMTITPTTSATDGSVTYTVDLTDVASKAALDAEIAARKAVDGQNGDTYAANSSANYISEATSLNDADVKLDAAVKDLQDAINDLDYADSAETGQYVTEVDQADGLISVERANISEAPLNNYAKGNDATSISSADTINQAVSKLENKLDVLAKATELELSAEADARQAIDGQNGSAYTPNASANYIAAATSLNDADVKLDAALKDVSDKINAAKVTEGSSVENYVALALDTATTAGTTALTINDSALKTKIDAIDAAITAETKARQDAIADLDSVGSASTTGHYLTSVTITDGKITAVGEEAVPAAVAITATTATPVDTASAVLTGVTASGQDNHNLTFGMSNKVFSAASADEAAKVANALSVSGYSDSSASTLDTAFAFDGSEAKSLTFGTNGPAGLKSMSMTSGGLVDVEVIDCGEY